MEQVILSPHGTDELLGIETESDRSTTSASNEIIIVTSNPNVDIYNQNSALVQFGTHKRLPCKRTAVHGHNSPPGGVEDLKTCNQCPNRHYTSSSSVNLCSLRLRVPSTCTSLREVDFPTCCGYHYIGCEGVGCCRSRDCSGVSRYRLPPKVGLKTHAVDASDVTI
jgi:hypothetical protein